MSIAAVSSPTVQAPQAPPPTTKPTDDKTADKDKKAEAAADKAADAKKSDPGPGRGTQVDIDA